MRVGLAAALALAPLVAAAQVFCFDAGTPCPCQPDAGSCTCSEPACALGCSGLPCSLTCSASAACALEVASGGSGQCTQTASCRQSGSNVTLGCIQATVCEVDAGANTSFICDQSMCSGRLGDGARVTQRSGGDLELVVGNDAGVLCTGSGACRVRTGERATVACGPTSICEVTVGDRSEVSCLAPCAVLCEAGCSQVGGGSCPTCLNGGVAFSSGLGCGCRLPDAGTVFDGGVAADAGVDAGTTLDGGMAADAGVDAGTGSDGGSAAIDAGAPADAGSGDGGLPDAGTADGGVTTDAGSTIADGGSGADGGLGDGGAARVDEAGAFRVGCGCSGSMGAPWLLLLVHACRRRRRGRSGR